MITLWLTIVLLGIVGWVIYQFNTLVGLSNDLDAAWAQIDSQFVRRYELVARLLDLTKAQAANAPLAAARTAAMKAYTPGEKSKTEPLLTAAIATVQWADNEEFSQTKQTLADTENYLRIAGMNYNMLVEDLNTRASRFPNHFLAAIFGVQLREPFQPEAR
jgi:LemA protein